MGYKSWFNAHGEKHKKIVDELVKKEMSAEEIIAYFLYDNISKSDVDFCPLFAQGKKCHDMKALNCYLCACPNFRFNDSNKVRSFCAIESVDGAEFVTDEGIVHQDCSGCRVPHKHAYVQKNFTTKWFDAMEKCNQNT